MLNTGEKTSALWDKTGEFTGVPDTIIMSRDFKSIQTDDCWDPDESFGWATVCPRERDYVGGVTQAWPCVTDNYGVHIGTKGPLVDTQSYFCNVSKLQCVNFLIQICTNLLTTI